MGRGRGWASGMESGFRMGVKGLGIRFQDRVCGQVSRSGRGRVLRRALVVEYLDRGRASSSGFEVGVRFRSRIGIQGLGVSVGFWGWGQVEERGRGSASCL